MNENRKILLQEYIRGYYPFSRKMHSDVLYPKASQTVPKSQLILMYMLLENNSMTIKEIASELHITSSAATQLVERLVSISLVERRGDTVDRRQVYIQLTGDGVREAMSYQDSLVSALAGVFTNLSDEALVEAIEFQHNVIHKEME